MDIRVALSETFFSALVKLHPSAQAKVNQLVLKFQNNPKSPGINYETLDALKDKHMRSIRVDQAYRVILLAPKQGNVYLFLWVEHHQKAYEWANRHQCKVNPNTGSLQVYSSSVEEITHEKYVEKVLGSFDALKDRQLLKLGVPEEQIELVRSVTNENELDSIQNSLPLEAYEALFLFSAGQTYDAILLERDLSESEQFDTENYSGALERLSSMSRFFVPAGERELREILEASLDKWRVFLHPTQRKLAIGDKNGPVRVLGGAGTGKTVVAMHRAKWLAENVATNTNKVLFTTFTKNLAIDISNNLRNICSEELFNKIEVVNLDQWVQQFLQSHVYGYRLLFDENQSHNFWIKAFSKKPVNFSFSDNFYREEWQRVIQPQGISSLRDYKKASRVGRGTRLDREQRVAIWPVFEEYRKQLDLSNYKEIDDAYREAALLIAQNKTPLPYCSVVVDEAQDMGSQAFHLIRTMVSETQNDLFIVGDAHQRIYGRNKVVLGQCGINIKGRSTKLKINYRTTEEIRKTASNLLNGKTIDDLDGGEDTNTLYKSLTHGEFPIIERFNFFQEQAAYIKKVLTNTDEVASNYCVVARTNKEVSAIQDSLNNIGINTSVIKPNEADSTQNCVKLATVHRVKGLEFNHIILASANEELIPLEFALRDSADSVSLNDIDTEERSLVYVAITRARKSAYILGYGRMSKYFS